MKNNEPRIVLQSRKAALKNPSIKAISEASKVLSGMGRDLIVES